MVQKEQKQGVEGMTSKTLAVHGLCTGKGVVQNVRNQLVKIFNNNEIRLQKTTHFDILTLQRTVDNDAVTIPTSGKF